LTDDGILGYIVPSKFTKVGAGKKLRELLSEKEYLHSIVSFGANQVFADKTTYTCLLILNKKPQNTFQYAEVKSLKSWKVREPEAVKYASKKTKELDSEVWVLVPPELTKHIIKLFLKVRN
jgi:type I restriction-modification system DNA methylase subunit